MIEMTPASTPIWNSDLISTILNHAKFHPHKTALFQDNGPTLTYADLKKFIVEFQSGEEAFVFLALNSNVESISTFLSLIARGISVAIVSETFDDVVIAELISRYRPDAIYGASSVLQNWGFSEGLGLNDVSKFKFPEQKGSHSPIRIPQILLGTSGSTGSPKMVRLAYASIDANAADIANGLEISASDVAITVLPLSYTYGLSVVTSHLWAGASIFCSSLSPLDKDFIPSIRKNKVTNIPGVPFNFAIYKKIGLFKNLPPTVRYFSQAGGAMGLDEVISTRESLEKLGVSLYVMYGQTEATARIAICPPAKLAEHPDSVGYSVKSGSLKIGSANDVNEIVFTGPNVMLGYALNRADLSGPDELSGVLETGDLGRLEDGLLYITGRIKRIAKINGIRINTEELESKVNSICEAAVTADDNKIYVYWVGIEIHRIEIENVLKKSALLPRDFELISVEAIPRLSSGKVNYPKLLS